MADITDIANVPTGTALSEGQIQGIINQIDLNIFNILAEDKHAAAQYAQYGEVGGSFNGRANLVTQMELKKSYEKLLSDIQNSQMFISQADLGG